MERITIPNVSYFNIQNQDWANSVFDDSGESWPCACKCWCTCGSCFCGCTCRCH